jgi:hypothetical protein
MPEEEGISSERLADPAIARVVIQRLLREAQERWSAGSEIPREEVVAWLEAHCTQAEWDATVKRWRDEKHGVSTPNNDSSSLGA